MDLIPKAATVDELLRAGHCMLLVDKAIMES